MHIFCQRFFSRRAWYLFASAYLQWFINVCGKQEPKYCTFSFNGITLVCGGGHIAAATNLAPFHILSNSIFVIFMIIDYFPWHYEISLLMRVQFPHTNVQDFLLIITCACCVICNLATRCICHTCHVDFTVSYLYKCQKHARSCSHFLECN